jgi:hypothetical protein
MHAWRSYDIFHLPLNNNKYSCVYCYKIFVAKMDPYLLVQDATIYMGRHPTISSRCTQHNNFAGAENKSSAL